ncbi:MAG: RNA-processing protein [Candidatus Lokiarchaeota archaeon]|nr:RNA-processing protein [Candidatus Lokiarchaeota archaeon]
MSFMVPMDRVAVIIGKDGATKKRIEDLTSTEIDVDSKSGSVLIKRKETPEANIGDWIAQNVIKAIARGFNPAIAEKLVNEDYLFEIIDLERVVGKSQNQIHRVKSRLIGEAGKTWKTIETMAGVHLQIFGNTVSLIGKFEEMQIAREAINMLLGGRAHSGVYKFLQKKHEELKQKRMADTWKPASEW